jgi:hypothetical protein
LAVRVVASLSPKKTVLDRRISACVPYFFVLKTGDEFKALVSTASHRDVPGCALT